VKRTRSIRSLALALVIILTAAGLVACSPGQPRSFTALYCLADKGTVATPARYDLWTTEGEVKRTIRVKVEAHPSHDGQAISMGDKLNFILAKDGDEASGSDQAIFAIGTHILRIADTDTTARLVIHPNEPRGGQRDPNTVDACQITP